MKKGAVGVLCIFGMRLVLTIVACVILRWGVAEQDMEVGAGSVGSLESQNAEWVSELDVAKITDQIIVVSAEGTQATLSMYEKNESGEWNVLVETQAYIGKNGIGKVREGDNKSPIGQFRFTKAFGTLENPGAKLEYTKVDQSHYWVDDKSSTYYNQFVSTDEVEMDWESAEHLCEYGQPYHYVLAINYNEDCVPGAGSAIFLHCTSDKAKATAGCIAIPEEDMVEIMKNVEEQCILIIDTAMGIYNY